jgi:hypothetical protein
MDFQVLEVAENQSIARGGWSTAGLASSWIWPKRADARRQGLAIL